MASRISLLQPSPPKRDLLAEIQQAQEELLAAEVDWTLVQHNLQLTPAERLRQHDTQLNTILALRRAARSKP